MSDWAFALLALSIAATWCPGVRIPVLPPGRTVALWPWPFAAGCAAGAAAGVLAWPALAALALAVGAAAVAVSAPSPRARTAGRVATALLALALAVHAVPGFHNPKVFDAVVLSPGAVPFTQYLNFDKGAAGLMLLWVFVIPARADPAWRRLGPPAAVTTIGATAVVAVVVLGSAVAAGLVVTDPKWPPLAPTFLAANLFFTCVAEEAFFRGVVQSRLPSGWVGVAASAALFGFVHLPAGVAYACLATLLGLGCAGVFDRTRRLEAAIAVHFGVNALHFLLFTYPMRASA